MRNFSPAHERRPQGLRTHIDTFPMMAFSGSSAKKLARHRAFSGSSAKNSPGTALSQQFREKLRPARGFQWLIREKTRPARLKTAFFARFGLAGRTFSRSHPFRVAQGELFRT